MEKIWNWIIGNKARFFLSAGVLAAIILLALDWMRGFDKDGVLVEAHGMFFDIILFTPHFTPARNEVPYLFNSFMSDCA